MFIEIDNDVSMPPEVTQRTQRKRTKTNAIPAAFKRCVEAYKHAYQVVYGVTPEISFRDGYLRIRGQEAGVTKTRLREMTTQLRWRAG